RLLTMARCRVRCSAWLAILRLLIFQKLLERTVTNTPQAVSLLDVSLGQTGNQQQEHSNDRTGHGPRRPRVVLMRHDVSRNQQNKKRSHANYPPRYSIPSRHLNIGESLLWGLTHCSLTTIERTSPSLFNTDGFPLLMPHIELLIRVCQHSSTSKSN